MIEICHLSFSYKEKEIFKDLNAVFPDKGLVVILGRSGCGKTTLLSLLSKQLLPSKGEIKGIGECPSRVFQSPLLIDYLSVLDNVLLPLKLKGIQGKERGEKALRRTGLIGKKDQYPSFLSGGEARRVSLSRALADNEKKVRILDEPTGQLDGKSSKEIYSLIKEISKDRLVIRVTHDEENAKEISDFLYELIDGKLILKKGNRISLEKDSEREAIATPFSLSLKDSINWNLSFLKKKRFRVLLSSLFLAFNFVLLFLGRLCRQEVPSRTKSLSKEYYAYDVAEIKQKEVIAKEGNRTLQRYAIPERKTLLNLSIKSLYPSLDYFLPPSSEVRIKGKTLTASFYPSFETGADSFIRFGNEAVINDSLLAELNRSYEEVQSSAVIFHHQALIYSPQFQSSDRISLDFSFKIVGLSKEKKIFNQPRIYYSYPLRRSRLSKEPLKEISKECDRDRTLNDLFSDATFRDDDFLSHKALYQTANVQEDKEKASLLFGDRIRISSPSLTRTEGLESIVSSLTFVLGAFLVLSLISSILLLFRVSYSLEEDNLRRFALIQVFAGKKPMRRKRILSLSFLFTLLTGFLFLLLSVFFILGGNKILSLYSFPSLFSLSPGPFMAILFLIFLSSLVGCFLPLLRIKDDEIKSQLEGED